MVCLLGCGVGAPPDARPRSDVDLTRVQTSGLAFHPATPPDAAALRACATWLPATGLGSVRVPLLVSNEGHAAVLTTRHLLLLEPPTCARREQPYVLADVVTDAAERRRVAQAAADPHHGPALPDAPYFRLVPSDTGRRDAQVYVVPVAGGRAHVVSLAVAGVAHSSVVVQAESTGLATVCEGGAGLALCLIVAVIVIAIAVGIAAGGSGQNTGVSTGQNNPQTLGDSATTTVLSQVRRCVNSVRPKFGARTHQAFMTTDQEQSVWMQLYPARADGSVPAITVHPDDFASCVNVHVAILSAAAAKAYLSQESSTAALLTVKNGDTRPCWGEGGDDGRGFYNSEALCLQKSRYDCLDQGDKYCPETSSVDAACGSKCIPSTLYPGKWSEADGICRFTCVPYTW